MYWLGLLLIIVVLSKCFPEVKEGFIRLLSPLSKSEPKFEPEKWNRDKHDIQKYNNCYAYAMNDLEHNRGRKPHPGHLSGIESNSSDYTCDLMSDYLLKDNPGAYKVDFETPCKCNYYKTMLVVDPKKDFHLYRQDSNGMWSHKPGSRKVTDKDASGNKIFNPKDADRIYEKYKYTDSCSFFCTPVNQGDEKKCN